MHQPLQLEYGAPVQLGEPASNGAATKTLTSVDLNQDDNLDVLQQPQTGCAALVHYSERAVSFAAPAPIVECISPAPKGELRGISARGVRRSGASSGTHRTSSCRECSSCVRSELHHTTSRGERSISARSGIHCPAPALLAAPALQ